MIQYLSSLSPPIPFDFGEVACGPGSIPGDSYILERSLGAALWQIDFMLYSMTVGVNRVHIQSGYGFNFSLWQPDDFAGSPAAVYANYYAHVFVASLIGRSGSMQAVELAGGDDTHVSYAAYDNGTLARVALVNMDFFDGTTSDASSRTSTNFTVAVPQGVRTYTVHTLTAPEGAMAIDTSNIFFAGQTYTLDQDGMAQLNSSVSTISNGTVQNGQVTVSVAASEAVILYMGDVGMNGTSTTGSSSSTMMPSSTSTGGPSSTGAGVSPAAATESKKGAANGLGVQIGAVFVVAVLTALVL
jgi:hypothetical protein